MTTKTSAKDCRIRLEKRDLRILSALETWGVLGLGQIIGLAFRTDIEPRRRARYFFNETPREEYTLAAYKRLAQLEKAGYVRTQKYVNLPQVYILSEAGHLELQGAGLAGLPGFRASIADMLVSHELQVSAVGLVLTQMMGLTVRTEQERYVWSGRGGWSPAPEKHGISDLWIVDRERPKAVEVELTQKSKWRYRDIWQAYRRLMPLGGAVLYLTKWPKGVECILGHAANFSAEFVYVCDLAEFRDSAARAPFRSYVPGRSIRLDAPSTSIHEGAGRVTSSEIHESAKTAGGVL